MKLNRDNYEEYFILYLDNELDSESRREVEAFAEANPDLKAELDLLQQSKLAPDTSISYSDKDSLMRFHHSTISLANYEEWLIAYIDNELPEEERKDAERFIAGNPSIQRELNLLQRTKLQPEAIVFPYKESLYRKEEKARVIPVRWWRIAAAAVLLFAISTTTIVLINNSNKGNETGNGTTAAKTNEEKSKGSDTINEPGRGVPGNEQVATIDEKKKDKPNETKPEIIMVKQNGTKPEEKKDQVQPVKDNGALIADNNEKKSAIDRDQTTNNSTVNSKTVTGTATTPTGADDSSLTKDDGNSKADDVTRTTTDTYNKSDEPDNRIENSDVKFASNNSSNGQKGGVRGFLRKVTRTFEKRTNIKATDDDDRLLIAGLAIKL